MIKMNTPKEIIKHELKYKPDAWKAWTPEECLLWERLFLKRATMRVDGSPGQIKDLEDASNYRRMYEGLCTH
jgi:hypothetical protein